MSRRSLVERLFELALRAFPRPFRTRYGGEMRAAFRESVSAGAHRIWLRRVASIGVTLGEVVMSGWMERVAPGDRLDRGRRERGGGGVDTLMNEIRIALRRLLRRPAFALQAMLTVALGAVGLTTIYPVLHHVVIRPLPFDEPDRLATLRTALDQDLVRDQDLLGTTAPELRFLAEQEDMFERVAAVLPPQYDQGFTWTDSSPRERLRAVQATPNLFQVLGVEIAGSGFDPAPAAGSQVVLSHGFWASRFGASRDVIGANLSLNETPHSIVGVLPAEFEFPLATEPFDVWVVRRLDPALPPDNDNRVFRMVARLAEGATLDGVQARVPRLIRDFHDQNATGIVVQRVDARSLHEDLVGSVRTPLMLLTAAATVVLVVASLNLALLLSARNLARGTELAIRRAVGAGSGRIARLLLIEAGVVAAAGAVSGALLGRTALSTLDLERAVGARLAEGGAGMGLLPALATVFVLGVVVLTALAPAVRAARSAALGSRSQTAGREARRSIAWVVGAETALVFGLLVAGGLTLLSLEALTRVDPGFNPQRAVAVEVNLPQGRYEDAEVPQAFERMADRLEALPGVVRAGSITHLPLDPDNWGGLFAIEGRDHPSPGALPLVDWEFASPGYFEAAGIPLVEGRTFTSEDVHDAPLVAVINETLARRYWPDSSPIGARVNGNGLDGTWFTVVGVVRDVKQRGLAEESRGYLYMSSLQSLFWPERHMVVRTAAADPARIVPHIRSALLELEPDLTVGSVRALEEVVQRASGAFRLRALVFGSLGVVAALLGMAGIHGVASHGVQARRREVGIRMAVGAGRNRVFRMMLGDGLRPVLTGMLAGAVLAWLSKRWLDAYLFGVEGEGPAVLVAMAGLLMLAALGAVLPPALRARRVDPVRMLQE